MKKKVLHILGGMGRGGAPIFIVNNLKYLDNNKVEFDFLCRKNNCAYNEIIQQKGGKIVVVPDFPRYFISNFIETYKFFKQHACEYEAIHVHANALYYLLPLVLGKLFHIKKIILHSHNTKSNVGFLQPIHFINRLFVGSLSNVHLACGQEAGRWMYRNKPFEVINNAVDANKFKYDETARNNIRKEFGISEDTFVIGNVGRFEIAKNHDFIIDVFKEYHSKNKASVLLLVGEGSLFEEVKRKVNELGLAESVVFCGLRADVNEIYSSMDLFFLPSLFEGLPFVLIEAQCSGLNCLVSDAVTNEAFITDLVTPLSLDNNVQKWVNSIDKLSKVERNRVLYSDLIIQKHYDIKYTAARLSEIYTK